jgi:hypothetical protein
VSPVRYELGFHIPEDDILHSHCRENLKPYVAKQISENSGSAYCQSVQSLLSSRLLSMWVKFETKYKTYLYPCFVLIQAKTSLYSFLFNDVLLL